MKMFRTTVLVVVLCFGFCMGNIDSLEAESVFYGVTLTAARNRSDSACSRELGRINEAVNNNERWALKLLDASGAPRTGLYWGNTFWLGSRKQCLSAADVKEVYVNPNILPYTKETPETISPFPLAYFVAHFFHNSTFQVFIQRNNETLITLGLCLPYSCSEEEVYELLEDYLSSGKLSFQSLYNTSFTMNTVMKTSEEPTWRNHHLSITYTMIMYSSWFLVLTATLYDWWFYNSESDKLHTDEHNSKYSNQQNNSLETNNGKTNDELQKNRFNVRESDTTVFRKMSVLEKTEAIFLSFSWYTNFSTVYTMKPSPGSLVPLSGIKGFLILGIINVHSTIFTTDFIDNRAVTFFNLETIALQPIMNSHFVIDIFYFISGFLMVYTASKSKDLKNETSLTNWQLFKLFLRGILKRFRRLTPVYFYLLTYTYEMWDKLSKISPFPSNERNEIQCRKYWWTNMLYINNIYPGTYDTLCMNWTYYIANDMQFFIIVSFLFYLSKKYFKTAVGLLSLIFTGSIMILGLMAYVTDFKPFYNEFWRMANVFYYPPWARINPYIIGAVFGYMYIKNNGKMEMRKLWINSLWIVSFLAHIYLFYGFIDRNMETRVSVLYMSLSRSAFGLIWGWILYSCLTGHGGLLNKFLSAGIWQPASRLTYVLYLVNPIVMYSVAAENDSPWHFHESGMHLKGYGFIIYTLLVSTLVVLGFEIPINKTIDILLNKKESKYTIKTKVKPKESDLQNKKDM